MKRKIIKIDEQKCNGCGLCIPNCAEGAIQLIDGKARLISDLFCDGLGACLGHCPEGAIEIEEREAEPYDERAVLTKMIPQGLNVVRAHLDHLKEHGEQGLLKEAMQFLQENGVQLSGEHEHAENPAPAHEKACGCPGAASRSFQPANHPAVQRAEPSALTHWPVQLHLISPRAPHYRGADLLLAADCVAYALGDFHSKHLQGKTLAIACPKLDEGQDIYEQKLVALIDEAKIDTLTVMVMQVPCCQGLLRLAQTAAAKAKRKIPIKAVVVGIEGGILSEQWV